MLSKLDGMESQDTLEDDVFSSTAKAERVKTVRYLTGATQLELANAAGISIATIRSWESGYHGGLTRHGAVKLLKGLESFHVVCSVNWLLSGAGTRPSTLDTLHQEVQLPKIPKEQLENELKNLSRCLAPTLSLIVPDDAMLPLYASGDCVLGPILSQKEALGLAAGTCCIVETEKYGLLVKTLIELNEHTITLVNSNLSAKKSDALLTQIKWLRIAPVTWHRKPIPMREGL